jgi:hypothetical protein
MRLILASALVLASSAALGAQDAPESLAEAFAEMWTREAAALADRTEADSLIEQRCLGYRQVAGRLAGRYMYFETPSDAIPSILGAPEGERAVLAWITGEILDLMTPAQTRYARQVAREHAVESVQEACQAGAVAAIGRTTSSR